MEKEFQDQRAVARQVPLKGHDILVAIFPQIGTGWFGWKPLLLEKRLVNPNDGELLVIRAVENCDPPPLRQHLRTAPEVIVRQLLRRRLLEGVDVHALRADARHYVSDRAVFAGRIHALENDEQRVSSISVKGILKHA